MVPQVLTSYLLTTEQTLRTKLFHIDDGKIRYLTEKVNMHCCNLQEHSYPPVTELQEKSQAEQSEVHVVAFSPPTTTKNLQHLINSDMDQPYNSQETFQINNHWKTHLFCAENMAERREVVLLWR